MVGREEGHVMSNSFDCMLVGLCHRIQWHGRTPHGEEVKEEEELSVDLSSFILTYLHGRHPCLCVGQRCSVLD